jgi:hypothetical protein
LSGTTFSLNVQNKKEVYVATNGAPMHAMMSNIFIVFTDEALPPVTSHTSFRRDNISTSVTEGLCGE